MPEPEEKLLGEAEPADEPETDDELGHTRMGFMDHLDELRVRLIRVGWGLLVCFIATYAFKEQIYLLLTMPLLKAAPQGVELIYLDPTEAFFTYLKAAFLAALVICSPWIFYQIWRFVAPGLYERERRMVWPFVITSSALFVGGAVLCFMVVFPYAFEFFRSFETQQANPPAVTEQTGGQAQRPVSDFRQFVRQELANELRLAGGGQAVAKLPERERGQVLQRMEDNVLDRALTALASGQTRAPKPGGLEIKAQFTMRNYLSFTSTLLLAFGLIFETPLVLVFLGRLGVVTSAKLRKARKYSILVAFVVGAVLTPPDVITQICMAVPLVLLYEVSIWLVAASERKKAAREQEEENDDEG